jgi:hypothetical protein
MLSHYGSAFRQAKSCLRRVKYQIYVDVKMASDALEAPRRALAARSRSATDRNIARAPAPNGASKRGFSRRGDARAFSVSLEANSAFDTIRLVAAQADNVASAHGPVGSPPEPS